MNRPYKRFRDHWIGNRIDYDGAYGYQCTDLIKQYLDECLGRGKQKALGNANQIPANLVKQGFVELKPTKNMIQGDIIVRTAGTYGHIAIVDRIVNGKVQVLEQNGTGKNSGSGKDGNEIRIKEYDISFFQLILRNEDIIRNYNKEVEYVEDKIDERARELKATTDYRECIQYPNKK